MASKDDLESNAAETKKTPDIREAKLTSQIIDNAAWKKSRDNGETIATAVIAFMLPVIFSFIFGSILGSIWNDETPSVAGLKALVVTTLIFCLGTLFAYAGIISWHAGTCSPKPKNREFEDALRWKRSRA